MTVFQHKERGDRSRYWVSSLSITSGNEES